MSDLVLDVRPLAMPWETADPFLFCVHHDDQYPAGNERLGPAASLAGRDIGQDFAGKDGWRMYHGDVVPGFPQHPHRGFETVTIVTRGLIDHTDSLGATARFGSGDVQWLTAGRGIVHSEMFPLLDRDGPNPLELFQIWLNLPKADKMVDPHFAMLWAKDIPQVRLQGANVAVIAGELAGRRPPPPPPHSWAAKPDSDVAIWLIDVDARGKVTLPAAAHPRSRRTLYFYEGPSATIGERRLEDGAAVEVKAGMPATIEAPADAIRLLLLQGVPIGEPVVQYGPFVMNSPGEVRKALLDYQTTRFGGWPFDEDAPVHPRDEGRFARHADGKVERVGGVPHRHPSS